MDGTDPARAAGDDVEAALEAERTRLADLLHDGPLSSLLAVRQDLLELHDPRLEAAVEALGDVATQLREVTGALHPDLLAGKPLAAALADIARAATGSRPTAIELDLRDTELLAPHGALVRSATLELTTNAVRHGGARRVLIATRRLPEGAGMEVTVAGDGERIDPEDVARRRREGHLGLVRLSRRVAAAGGSIAIGEDGQPSAVVLRLPLAAAERRRPAGEVGAGFHADPWCVVRDDASYAQVSDALTQLVGYGREEMLATAPGERPWFADRDGAAERRRAIIEGTLAEGHQVAHVLLRHRDGREIPALTTTHLLSRKLDRERAGFLVLVRPLPAAA